MNMEGNLLGRERGSEEVGRDERVMRSEYD